MNDFERETMKPVPATYKQTRHTCERCGHYALWHEELTGRCKRLTEDCSCPGFTFTADTGQHVADEHVDLNQQHTSYDQIKNERQPVDLTEFDAFADDYKDNGYTEDPEPSHYGTQADTNPLSKWWFRQSREMADACVAKDQEYGSEGVSWDLVETGQRMARMRGHFTPTVEEAIELAILFYLGGKLARWDGAVIGDRRVSDDTLLDIATYSMMALRNRDVHGWPNGDKVADPFEVARKNAYPNPPEYPRDDQR